MRVSGRHFRLGDMHNLFIGEFTGLYGDPIAALQPFLLAARKHHQTVVHVFRDGDRVEECFIGKSDLIPARAPSCLHWR
jgi:hypothetical protein